MDQIINTILRASGASQFSAQMNQIAGSAAMTQRAVQGVQGVIGGLKMAVLGAVGGATIGSVLQLGSSFEATQNKMAGFLSALGEAPNFTSALKLGADVMKKIEITSAALPGEAEDYVRVFTTSLPNVQRAVGGTMDEMVAFTNQISAIGSTFGIDSMQIAHDLNRMLQVGKGGAGLDVRTFTEMLPFLTRIKGQAGLTADSFNKLNASARAGLLKKAMVQLAPMVDHARDSFDAIKGTSIALAKTLFRTSAAPLFDGIKHSLSRVNDLLMDQNGNLTELGLRLVTYGKRFSTFIASALDKGVSLLERFFGNAKQIPNVFKHIEQAVKGAARALATYTAVSAAAGLLKTVGGVGSAIGGGAAAAGGMASLAAGAAAFAAAAVLVGPAVYAATEDMGKFKNTATELSKKYTSEVTPAMAGATAALGRLVEPLVHALGAATIDATAAALHGLGDAITWLAKKAESTFDSLDYLIKQHWHDSAPSDRQLLLAKYQVDTAKREHTYAKNHRTRSEANSFFGNSLLAGGSGFFQSSSNPFQLLPNKTPYAPMNPEDAAWRIPQQKKLTKEPPSQRGGNKVVQDFRGSKFTIDQKFEEGFDPDRVAVAFANDLRKVGEFRLQSGFEPLFGGGF